MAANIYIIDDDRSIRQSLKSLFEGEGFLAQAFADTSAFRRHVSAAESGVLLLDIALPGEDGLTFLTRFRKEYTRMETIMITGEATIDRAVAATRLGAYDFLEKPLNPERLLLSIRNLLNTIQLRSQLDEAKRARDAQYEIIGNSPAVETLKEIIAQVAPSDSTVMIFGENGTGKELAAYQIWAQSNRAERAYVRVNCAALPVELAESELFGFKKGAFTGADRNRDGKFKSADGGTLFLDEIGDLSGPIQSKLLRIIESRELEPLGADEPEKIDIRLITATNCDLEQRVKEGRFRADLFFRLNVLPLVVPPLRDRREDIPLLLEHFTKRLAANTALGAKQLTANAVGLLSGMEWPGNVRELKNMVERCFILCRSDLIDADEVRKLLGDPLSLDDSDRVTGQNKLSVAVVNFEKSFLEVELSKHGGNVSELARGLGIDRGNLSKKLKSYGIV